MKYGLLTCLIVTLLITTTACSPNTVSSNGTGTQSYDATYETGEYTYDDAIDSYDSGWRMACEDVFYYRSELYYNDYQYSIDDYYDFSEGEPSLDESYPNTDYPYTQDDLDEAYNQGREAALDSIFWDTDVLCYGEERYYRSEF